LEKKTINIPDSIVDKIEEFRKNVNKDITLKNKYSKSFNINNICKNIVVFDEDFQVYVLLQYDSNVGKHRYQGYSNEYDTTTCCVGRITLNTLQIVTHYEGEEQKSNIANKYKEIYTCNRAYSAIAVWDEEYQVYVILEGIAMYDNTMFRYKTHTSDKVLYLPHATVNHSNKTLSISTIPTALEFAESIRYLSFTCDNATADCEYIFVYHEPTENFIMFEQKSDGTWFCCGYVYWFNYCRAELDLDNLTLTIKTHDHDGL
jgi:hypothetical protein